MELDWQRLEEVVTRAVLRARSEEMKEVAEALKLLASYMKEGFEKTFKILQEHTNILQQHSKLLEEHSKLLERHEKRLEELARAVGELKVAVGSLGRRWGRDLERTVLELYRHALEERGVEPGRVEKFVYTDVDGRFYRRGAKIEVDVYIHDGGMYLVEVKSHAELDDVEWFYEEAGIVEKILGRKAAKLIIVAVNIDKEALQRAQELGIEAVYGAVIE
ncbi:Protein of unknown function (DUF1626) [Pyrobaculum sp. WP30]|nr:Protein of unknown function (DUF1626) [Pyrobaculum sp. WP30]